MSALPTPRASGGRAHRARTTWPRRAWRRSLRLKFVIPSVTSLPRFQLSSLRRLVNLLSTAFYPFVCKRRSFHEQPPLSQPQIHGTVSLVWTDGRPPRRPGPPRASPALPGDQDKTQRAVSFLYPFLGPHRLGLARPSWAPRHSPLTAPPPPGGLSPGATAPGRWPSASGVTTPCICARHLPSLRVSHGERSSTHRTHTAPGCPGRCPTAHGAPAVVTGRSKSQDLASRGLRVDMLAGGGFGSREVLAHGGPGRRTGVWIPGPARLCSQHGPLVTVSVFCFWGRCPPFLSEKGPRAGWPSLLRPRDTLDPPFSSRWPPAVGPPLRTLCSFPRGSPRSRVSLHPGTSRVASSPAHPATAPVLSNRDGQRGEEPAVPGSRAGAPGSLSRTHVAGRFPVCSAPSSCLRPCRWAPRFGNPVAESLVAGVSPVPQVLLAVERGAVPHLGPLPRPVGCWSIRSSHQPSPGAAGHRPSLQDTGSPHSRTWGAAGLGEVTAGMGAHPLPGSRRGL